jgi:hypothetical protein
MGEECITVPAEGKVSVYEPIPKTESLRIAGNCSVRITYGDPAGV